MTYPLDLIETAKLTNNFSKLAIALAKELEVHRPIRPIDLVFILQPMLLPEQVREAIKCYEPIYYNALQIPCEPLTAEEFNHWIFDS